MQEIRLRIDGAGPYGFRLFGGNGEPLVVAKLRPGSKAFNSGVKEGDIILAINDNSCSSDVTHAAAMSLVNNSGHCLDLKISRDEFGGNSFLSSSLGVRSQDSRTLSPSNFSTNERLPSPGRTENHVDYQGRMESNSSYLNGTGASPSGHEFTEDYDYTSVDGNTTSRATKTTEKFGGTTVTKVTRESRSDWSSAGPETEFRGSSPSAHKPGVWTPAKHEAQPLTFDLGRPPMIETKENVAPAQFSPQPPSFNQNKPGVWTPAKHEAQPLTFDLGRPPMIETKENVAPAQLSPQPPSFNQNKPGVWSPARQEGVQLTWDLGLPLLNERKVNAKAQEPSFFQNSTTINVEETKKSSTGGIWRPSHVEATFTPPSNLQTSYRPPSVQPSFTPSTVQTPGRPPSVQNSFIAPLIPSAPPLPGKLTKFPASNRQAPSFSKFDSDVGYIDELKQNNYTSPQWSRDEATFPGLPANISKILTAPSDNDMDSSTYASFNKRKMTGEGPFEQKDKKVFGDSAFYADSKHKYPTMEEQVKMARNVAMSLTSGDNTSARGHQMFLKRKEKSDAWVADNGVVENGAAKPEDRDKDLYYNPTPWNPAKTWKPSPGAAAEQTRGGYQSSSIPTPPPLPSSLLFAPNLKNQDERSKALSAEEFERVRLYAQKTTHNIIAPQVCFNLAKDLRENKGKGGRMFAKRREKADQWVVEDKGPDPAMLMKLAGGFNSAPAQTDRKQPESAHGVDERDYTQAPSINRLKEMIEIPKAKMTPWDAVAEYGNVELAFDHLKNFNFSDAKSLSSNSYQHQSSQRVPDTFEITPAPAGPPSWARSEVTEGFSSSSAVKPQFTPKVDFSQRSNAGYKTVQFSAPRQQGISVENNSAGYSEF